MVSTPNVDFSTSKFTNACYSYFRPQEDLVIANNPTIPLIERKTHQKQRIEKICSYVFTLGIAPLVMAIVYGCSLLHDYRLSKLSTLIGSAAKVQKVVNPSKSQPAPPPLPKKREPVATHDVSALIDLNPSQLADGRGCIEVAKDRYQTKTPPSSFHLNRICCAAAFTEEHLGKLLTIALPEQVVTDTWIQYVRIAKNVVLANLDKKEHFSFIDCKIAACAVDIIQQEALRVSSICTDRIDDCRQLKTEGQDSAQLTPAKEIIADANKHLQPLKNASSALWYLSKQEEVNMEKVKLLKELVFEIVNSTYPVLIRQRPGTPPAVEGN